MVDRVCTRCWAWFPGTLGSCPQCGAPLTAANAAPPPPALGPPSRVDPSSPPPAATPERGVNWLRWALVTAILAAVVLAVFPMPQLGLWGNPGCSLPGATCTRVLFIGNSYTSVNDLPGTFADLAWAGGHRVQTEALDEGGWTLAEHLSASETAPTIGSERWDEVVLQEQSQIPSLAADRISMMYPAATRLVAMVRQHGAAPLFYLTFAHQAGWPEEGLPDYSSMQAAIDAGYIGIADQLGVPVAPVGAAWQTVVDAASHPAMWQSDGSHPTVSGTYLAACVFYATIFRQSPLGLGYADGLPNAEARTLQTAAAKTVLGDSALWGLTG
ncbi:MAG: DUF4886 domain-containing protein [Candidatus Dormibacteria bacterium]